MLLFLGWLWAWYCDPSEMMRQRRQRIALEDQRQMALMDRQYELEESWKPKHVTSMSYKGSRSSPEWTLECRCGWSRVSFWTDTAKVRELLDKHENEGVMKS